MGDPGHPARWSLGGLLLDPEDEEAELTAPGTRRSRQGRGCDRVPPAQWLKMCPLSVLEVGSLKGTCWAEIKVVGWLCSS